MNEQEALEDLRQCERWVAMAYGDGFQGKPFVNYEGSDIGAATLRTAYDFGVMASKQLQPTQEA